MSTNPGGAAVIDASQALRGIGTGCIGLKSCTHSHENAIAPRNNSALRGKWRDARLNDPRVREDQN
jgi:hypothetical protein